MSKVQDFLEALHLYGDGRLHYWNGTDGVGCSDYVKMSLYRAGIITRGEYDNTYSLWAIHDYHNVLNDTTRFRKHSASETPKDGWIEWYAFHHTAVFYRNGQFEASPESTHYLSSNGKTGVGYYPTHHNCSGGTLTCYYEIIEEDTSEKLKADDVCKLAIDVCMGVYGDTGYWNAYPWNVGKYGEGKWWFDCLGFVHEMTSIPQFAGDRNVLGGGAKMDSWVLNTTEDATLKSCTTYSQFNGTEPKRGELLQSSGHVGIYIGEYKVDRGNGNYDVYNTAECTSAFGGGCMLTWVDITNGYRYNKKGGTYRSIWNYHGQFSQVDYSEETSETIMEEPVDTTKYEVLEPKQKLEIATEIIDMKWGVNPERREKLSARFGTDVAIQLQELVNKACE